MVWIHLSFICARPTVDAVIPRCFALWQGAKRKHGQHNYELPSGVPLLTWLARNSTRSLTPGIYGVASLWSQPRTQIALFFFLKTMPKNRRRHSIKVRANRPIRVLNQDGDSQDRWLSVRHRDRACLRRSLWNLKWRCRRWLCTRYLCRYLFYS